MQVKVKKKAWKKIAVIITVVFLFLFCFKLLLQSSGVQTYIAHFAAKKISEETGAKVDVQAVKISFFNSVLIKGLYIEDKKKDTLLYSKSLWANVSFNYFNQKIRFNNIQIADAFIHLKRLNDDTYNYSFLLNKQDTTGRKSNYELSFRDLSVSRSRFRYDEVGKPKVDSIIDFNHIKVSNLGCDIQQLKIKENESFSFNVEQLHFLSHKGLQVVSMQAHIDISPEGIYAKKLNLVTPQSHLVGEVALMTDEYKDFSDFNKKVQLKFHFIASEIGLSDIGYFWSQWYHSFEEVKLSGEINGTIHQLKTSHLKIVLEGGSTFEGSARIRGLPDIDNTFIHLNVDRIQTSGKMLKEMPYFKREKEASLKLIQTVGQFGNINFKGELTGFVNDFVAYGNFRTALGNFSTDLSLKNLVSPDGAISYSGKIKSSKFKLGEFFNTKKFNNTDIDVSIKGRGLDPKNMHADIDGEINYLDFLGYKYQHISAKGKFQKQKFNGHISIKDSALLLQFDGSVDLSKKIPELAFQTNIKKLQPQKLGFISNIDTTATFSAQMNVRLSGYDLNSMSGQLIMKDINYKDMEMNQKLDSINLRIGEDNTSNFILLRSEIMDAQIEGQYKLSNLIHDLNDILYKYFSNKVNEPKHRPTNSNIHFQFLFKKTALLSHLFIPNLSIENGSKLSGEYMSKDRQLSLKGNFPKLEYAHLKWHEGKLEITPERDTLFVSVTADKMSYKDSLYLVDFKFINSINNNTIHTSLTWNDHKKKNNQGDIHLLTEIYSDSLTSIEINHSSFKVKSKKWMINNENIFSTDFAKYFDIKNLSISSDSTLIKLAGTYSEKQQNGFKLNVHNFRLSDLNPFLAQHDTKLSGSVSGHASINSLFSHPVFNSDLTFDSLMLNNQLLGSGNMTSVYNTDTNIISVKGNLKREKQKIFAFSGSYFTQKEKDKLAIDLIFQKTPLKLFSKYLESYVSDVTGFASGKINISGDFKKPLFNGKLSLNKTAFKINYLNTNYQIADHSVIKIEPDAITADNLKLYDIQNNSALTNITIFHNNFKQWSYDIGVFTNNHPFIFLNSKYDNKVSYYGKAILSGMANISGYKNELLLDAHLKSEKGTDISIPISSGTDIAHSNFVIFTQSDTIPLDSNRRPLNDTNYTGLSMNFDLQVTPEAQVHIIFGGTGNDILNTNGTGRINLKISDRDGFKMFGKYTIQEGNYNFNLKNVINKRLTIERGSSINWTGDPYLAIIDVNASYKLRASLKDILQDPTSKYSGQRVPVAVQMHMYNKLMHPDIEFDIKLPTVDESTKEMVNSVLFVNSNEENRSEMNRQVFALLVLRKFLPPAGSRNGSSGIGEGFGRETSSEVLSNQLSNWLSQISSKVDVGFKYNPSENNISNDEMELGLSTHLFDNRVELNGNVGYVNSYNLQTTDNQFVGEFNIAYLITKNGNLRAIFFNHSNNDYLVKNNSKYTQGVGLHYRFRFDKFKNLFIKEDNIK